MNALSNIYEPVYEQINRLKTASKDEVPNILAELHELSNKAAEEFALFDEIYEEVQSERESI